MKQTQLILVVLILVLCSLPPWLPIARAADSPLGIPAEGPAFRGQLVAADAAWKLRFADAGSQREIAGADLALWGGFVEPAHGLRILLAGGGLVVLDSAEIKGEQLRGESQLFGKLDLPLELIAGIVFRPPLARAGDDQLAARMDAAGGQTDRVLLENGDELTGTIASLEGKVLTLQSGADKVDVETKTIAAVIFNPTLIHKSRPSGLRALVGFSDGSRVTAIAVTANKTSAQIKLIGGAVLQGSTDAIAALQPLGGRAVYLSDLKPTSFRHIPYLQLAWPFVADRSVLGGQLRAGGKLYAKGLGMHSPARITYDFDRPYRRFETEVAIDAEAGPGGSAVFHVFTDDGSGTWQERATSETIRGGDPPATLSGDVSGAKRISLLVDFADHGDELDHADWLNARLVR